MKKLVSIIVILASLSIKASIQEDVQKIEARFGGSVQKTKTTILEVVPGKEKTSIYITGHDHKNLTDKKLSLSAIALVKGKPYPLELSFENDHYSVKPANSFMRKENNYVLILSITFPTGTEKARFNVSH